MMPKTEETVLVKEVRAMFEAMHKKYPQAGIMICIAERDARNVGYDVQTLVTEYSWLGLFLKAVWDYQQSKDTDESDPKTNVH